MALLLIQAVNYISDQQRQRRQTAALIKEKEEDV
jgi:hypothetical protein